METEDLVQPQPFLRFESVDQEHNRARFYTLDLQRTLWGELAVVCTWGRIGGPGRSLARIVGDQVEAAALLEKAAARRIKRGYQPKLLS